MLTPGHLRWHFGVQCVVILQVGRALL